MCLLLPLSFFLCLFLGGLERVVGWFDFCQKACRRNDASGYEGSCRFGRVWGEKSCFGEEGMNGNRMSKEEILACFRSKLC